MDTPDVGNPEHLRFAAKLLYEFKYFGAAHVMEGRADQLDPRPDDDMAVVALAKAMFDSADCHGDFDSSRLRDSYVARARRMVADPNLSITVEP